MQENDFVMLLNQYPLHLIFSHVFGIVESDGQYAITVMVHAPCYDCFGHEVHMSSFCESSSHHHKIRIIVLCGVYVSAI